MKSSPEPGGQAVLLDANVLSRLARVHRLDILVKALPGNRYVTPAIYREVEAGVAAGITYLNDVLSSIAQGEIHVLELEDKDDSYAASLPPKLGAGEAEAARLADAWASPEGTRIESWSRGRHEENPSIPRIRCSEIAHAPPP